MNPESPKNPGEELELRITALLLGELSADEAATLRQNIARDAELSRLHDRLKFAIELTRETTIAPSEEEAERPDTLKLAPERRAKLLAAFAAPKMIKLAAARRAHRRELLALAAMLAVLLVVASMLLPSLAKSKARAQRLAWEGGRPLLAVPEDREEAVQATVSREGIEDLNTTIARRPLAKSGTPPARYYAASTSPGNEPAPAAPTATPPPALARAVTDLELSTTPARPPAASTAARDAVSESVRRSVGVKDPESGKLSGYGGRIELPEAEVPRGDEDISRSSNVSDSVSVSDSKLPSANRFVTQFAWTAPSGGGGSGGGGAGGPAAPQQPQEEWTRAKVAVVGGKDGVERKPADARGATINLYSELAVPPVDPATGLPAPNVERFATDRDSGVVPQFTNPDWIGVTDRAIRDANVALSYGIVTNSVSNLHTFADISPDQAAADDFQTRLRGVVNRAANPGNVEFVSDAGQKNDLGVDGLRGWFDSSSNTVAENANVPAAVIIDGIADNPAAKPYMEAKRDLESLQQSRDLESLRLMRDRLASRIAQEKVDTSIPRTSNVQIIDPAEADPAERESFWKRLGGAFSSGVERSVRIAVPKETPVDRGFTNQGIAGGYDPYWMQTEAEQIESKTVLSKVVEKLNLDEAWAEKHGAGNKAEDALGLLREMTTVSQDPKSGLIDIKVKSEKAEEAARIANTIAEVFREQRIEERQQATIRGVATLEKELVDQEKKIAEVEQRFALRSASEPLDAGAARPAPPPPVPQPEIVAAENRFSTFSLNVSDVSFKLAAASLEKGGMPEPATVRTEEFINAFDYRDPEPGGSAPIAFAWERARYPFAHDRDLVRLSVKTAASGRQPGRPLNLVLLLDNSGSMERSDRLRIRQECLRVLASQLHTNDRISVVAFARTAQLWVDGLPGDQSSELPQRVGGLTPQGGTNLEEAMNLAYQTALRHFRPEGVNRVVLLTDGAANLGDVEPESLKKKVEANRRQGIALDCFGIGWEGYNDDLLEVLSRNGDGRYGFVNTTEAASSEFAGQLAGALKVAASDVKVQVEFNPRRVTAYRQMGYAKHQLTKEQFRDNTVDAAEIGVAEAGNALYVVQVNPRGEGPLGTVRVRFKVPGTGDYREHEWPVPYDGASKPLEQSPFPMRLAGTAAAFSEWLVSSPYAAEVAPDRLLTYLSGVPESCPADPRPKKLEWMIRQAKSVAGK
jgi:Mg-chelatase subunit ChlD